MKSAPPREFVSERDRKWKESLVQDPPNGRVTLVAGQATVYDSRVRDDTNIFITRQSPGGTIDWLTISARTSGVSFNISSNSALDTSVVAWMMLGAAN